MVSSTGIPHFSILCLLITIFATISQAKHHHHPIEHRNQNQDDQGYCMKSDRKHFANEWTNTTMDIQYTKTVKVETSRENAAKLRESTRQMQERYRRSVEEAQADKKKKKRKNKKARKDKKKSQKEQKTETTTQAPQQQNRRRRSEPTQQAARMFDQKW